ncbi:Crp/Fnr family transcriptional regulator [Sporosarcina pasteurii]|uniref:cAMP regulatory protein n=1 Tax=Sporosarcina pasteurii TaxID=1474 RepID=A0A380C1X4_SPOPA|nr:Crp/Fnr family transcriptional regulator [Sporosarcina pasteurii]MDS9471598.1 Crp/Fnr family transcriptional regulator [Sporosarcina pasteurii]QBQ04788.1 Crp/Fnr family transcriptional regulator [Sporosarcina pasteurii]SUJ11252.1 cAMP regulatory protein [Sporosarcina pasteurii]
MEQLKTLAKNVTLFKDLSDEELKPFLNIMRRREFLDKQMIFMHDTPITDIYIVASGNVKVFRNDLSGKEQIICVKQLGDLFPNVGFFRKENYPAHSQAMEETVLYAISLREFEEVLLVNPHISIKLFRLLGDLIIDSQQRLEEMALRNTNDRILLLLLRLSESHGTRQPDGWLKLNTKFTNSDLANMIGTTRESVNRMISRLRKEDKVKIVEGDYYIIPDKIQNEIAEA